MDVISQSVNFVLTKIGDHPVVTLYIVLGLVNSMQKEWDGWYNFTYRFLHLMLNAPQLQTLEQKHGVVIPPTATISGPTNLQVGQQSALTSSKSTSPVITP